MTDQDMIAAIVSALQTQSNLLLLLTSQVTNSVQSMQTSQLQQICTILGIDYTQGS